jgi:thiamine-phosphate pyrophosphorylase
VNAPGHELDFFYPILPDIAWLERLVPLGIRTVQLRLKDKPANEVRRQISLSLKICAQHKCQLIVNDYWRETIELGADYVHLGQEDLAAADLATIQTKGIKVGISTHSHEELAVALAAKPCYVALGPIYLTKLKVMRWEPQGLGRIAEWKALIRSLPLVAIGGLTVERAPGAVAGGAQSVAVVTDIVTNSDPETRVRQWLGWARSLRC